MNYLLIILSCVAYYDDSESCKGIDVPVQVFDSFKSCKDYGKEFVSRLPFDKETGNIIFEYCETKRDEHVAK